MASVSQGSKGGWWLVGVGGQRRVLSLPGQTSFDLSVHCFEPQTDRSAGLTLTRDGQLRSGIRGRRAEATTSLSFSPVYCEVFPLFCALIKGSMALSASRKLIQKFT